MAEPVELPSGLTLDLQPASIRRLLAVGEPLGVCELADACMDRASVGVALLGEEDAFAVAEWCIGRLADDAEAVTLASLCELYCESPSVRLGVVDAVLAFELDAVLARAVRAAEGASHEEIDETLPRRETDPWTPGGE